jgi:hypothetical protein
MEELLGALGISGPVLGSVIWYVKSRIVKNEKRMDRYEDKLKTTLTADEVQKMQINKLEEEVRELRKHLLK